MLTPQDAREILLSGDSVVNIGQLAPETLKQLKRWEKDGRIVRGVYVGFPIPKTAWAHPDLVRDGCFLLSNPKN